MGYLVLTDIDPVLTERIEHIARTHGWSMQETAVRLLEQALLAAEQSQRGGLNPREAQALAEAIAALQQVPGRSE